MRTLGEAQRKFTLMFAEFIIWVYSEGYELSLGEAWRPRELAKFYAEQNKGIANSLHTDRLAIDLNLFKDGRYLSKTEDYRPLGEKWEAMGGAWGGHFSDGNHFSLPWGGRK